MKKQVNDQMDILQTLCDTLHANMPRTTVCVSQSGAPASNRLSKWSRPFWSPIHKRKPFVSTSFTPISDPGVRCCAPRFSRKLDCIWEEDEFMTNTETLPFVLKYAGAKECLPTIENKSQEIMMRKWLKEADGHVDELICGTKAPSSGAIVELGPSQPTRPSYALTKSDSAASSMSSTSSSTVSTLASSIYEEAGNNMSLIPCQLASNYSTYIAIPMSSEGNDIKRIFLVLFPDNSPATVVEEQLVRVTYKLCLSIEPENRHTLDVKESLRSLQHILRTPLHGMAGMAEQIRDTLDMGNSRDRMIERHLSSMSLCQQEMNQQIDFFLGGGIPGSPFKEHLAEFCFETGKSSAQGISQVAGKVQHEALTKRNVQRLGKRHTVDMTSYEQNRPFRVLAVEDNPINMQIISRILTVCKMDFAQAWDGQEAIASFKEYRPDLVLLDINLPIKNGFTVAKEIRELDNTCKIIAMTALCSQCDRDYGLKDCQMDEWHTKPFGGKALAANLMEWKREWEMKQPIMLERQWERSQMLFV